MKLYDTSVWVDFFAGAQRAAPAKAALNSREAAVSVITLAEIKLKQNKAGKPSKPLIDFIRNWSTVLELDEETALLAGEFTGLHATDAMIYATAQKNGMELVTCDKDFRGMKGVKLLE